MILSWSLDHASNTFKAVPLATCLNGICLLSTPCLIYDAIVETYFSCIAPLSSVVNCFNPCPVDGSKTHGARFTRGVEVTVR